MEEYFELLVDHYVFDGIIEKIDDDILYIYIGNTKRRQKACIFIEISIDDKYAILHNLEYFSNCDLNNRLHDGAGTKIMAKTALKFVIDNYNYIKHIDLFDKGKKNGINITPKRLLLGQKGWYEEYFGAKPNIKDNKTKSVMRSISKLKLTEKDRKIMEKRDWGTDEEVSDTCRELRLPLVIGTSWRIDRKTIMNYNIKYEIRKVQKGGGEIKDKLIKIINKAEYSNVSWQNF